MSGMSMCTAVLVCLEASVCRWYRHGYVYSCFVNVGICFTIGSEVMVLKGSAMMAILSN